MSIAKKAEPRRIDLDRTHIAINPPKTANRNLILGAITLLGVSAGFWVVLTLTISRWLR